MNVQSMGFQALLTLLSTWLLLVGTEPGFTQSTEGVPQALNSHVARSNSAIAQVSFTPPPQDGKPTTSRGGGSRDNRQCPQDGGLTPANQSAEKPTFTALVPSDNYGVTWSERPTLWVYVPKTSARQIILSIKGNQHHSHFIPITGQPGIIGIQAVENSPPLEVGKTYEWSIVLMCGDRPSPNDPTVVASIRREQPKEQLKSQPALQQAVQYGKLGVWYDALTTLATAKRSQPNNPELAKTWTSFLTQPAVGLNAIAAEPVR